MTASDPGLHLILLFRIEGTDASSDPLENVVRALALILPRQNSYTPLETENVPEEVAAATRTFLERGSLPDRRSSGALSLAAGMWGGGRISNTVHLYFQEHSAVLVWSVSPAVPVEVNTDSDSWDGIMEETASADAEWHRAKNLWKNPNGLWSIPGLYGGAEILEVMAHCPASDSGSLAYALERVGVDDRVAGGKASTLEPEGIACRRRRNIQASRAEGSMRFFDNWVIAWAGQTAGTEIRMAELLVYGRVNEVPPIARYLFDITKIRYSESRVVDLKSQLHTLWDETSRLIATLSKKTASALLLELMGLVTKHGRGTQDQARFRETIRLAETDCRRAASWFVKERPKGSLFAEDQQVIKRARVQSEAAFEYARANNTQLLALLDLLRTQIEEWRREAEDRANETQERFNQGIHLLEVFIVGFYVLHMAHILSDWKTERLNDWVQLIVLALTPMLAGIVVVVFLKRRARPRAGATHQAQDHVPWTVLLWVLFLGLLAAALAYVLPSKHETSGNPTGKTESAAH